MTRAGVIAKAIAAGCVVALLAILVWRWRRQRRRARA
jgi:hypothetical protein